MSRDSRLYNEDLAPVPQEQRTWGMWNLAALWVGMAVCIPTYMLAAGLMGAGMNWWQALFTITLGNIIVLVPMVLNGHAGTKYGVSLPVLLRSSFGVWGANIPALMRGLVACGWFGIQTWIGGTAIYQMLGVMLGYYGYALWDTGAIPVLGITTMQLICFLIFWAINIIIILKGLESIKWLEDLSAPFLIFVGLALLGWGVYTAGGFEKIFSENTVRKVRHYAFTISQTGFEKELDQKRSALIQEEFLKHKIKFASAPSVEIKTAGSEWLLKSEKESYLVAKTSDNFFAVYNWAEVGNFDFWKIFFPLLTAMVGFWATLALNIPDFTCHAKSQKDQILGQAIGLPTTMALFSFIGIAVTAATVVIYGEAIWDPVQLLGRFTNPLIVVISLLGLSIATLSTNIAANVVAPANGFSNLMPEKISFKMGGILTGIVGIIIMPWKLVSDLGGYIFTWLIGYSAMLGAIVGIMIVDYYFIHKAALKMEDLYSAEGEYSYGGSGYNWRAVAALFLGILPNVPGFLQAATNDYISVPDIFNTIYTYAWFVGALVAGGMHLLLTLIFPVKK